jgi:hypothetical protein
MISLRAKIWGLRILFIVGMVLLSRLFGSAPGYAFCLAWGPNGLFLLAFMTGFLHLPRFLEPVHPMEPVLYQWIGVGLVKRIVATRLWPMLNGFPLPVKPVDRHEFLDRIELATKGAEICHGATFVLAFFVALYCLVVGWISAAVWILVFNMALNGYPVMLQRANRWRIHQVRAIATEARRI